MKCSGYALGVDTRCMRSTSMTPDFTAARAALYAWDACAAAKARAAELTAPETAAAWSLASRRCATRKATAKPTRPLMRGERTVTQNSEVFVPDFDAAASKSPNTVVTMACGEEMVVVIAELEVD